jgi:SPP1 gp7 family putative phage head morphogenesis protein
VAKISKTHKKRIRKKVDTRRKTRPFKEPDFPDTIVLEYGKALVKEVNKIDELVKEILIPQLNKITNTKNERLDSTIRLDFDLKKLAGVALVAELIRRIKSKFYGEVIQEDQEPNQRLFSKSARRLSNKFLKRGDQFQEKKFTIEFERQTGTLPLDKQLNVQEFMDEALARNVNLIKTIPAKHFSDLSTLVDNAVRKGELSTTLKKKIIDVSKATKKRARFIARDQIGKLVGDFNEVRQRNVGVEEYIWRTMGDSRVRSLSNTNGVSDHKHLDGTIQKWSKPPVVVFSGKRAGERHHPKSDFGCRCEAQPVYDAITGIDHPETIKARKKTEELKRSAA